jgi:hypothetical protein
VLSSVTRSECEHIGVKCIHAEALDLGGFTVPADYKPFVDEEEELDHGLSQVHISAITSHKYFIHVELCSGGCLPYLKRGYPGDELATWGSPRVPTGYHHHLYYH